MNANKKTVERYIDGFNRSDHIQILSCLTEDVEWILPGVFHLNWKAAFDKEIENPAFEGKPVIVVNRAIEKKILLLLRELFALRKKMQNISTWFFVMCLK